MLKTALMVQMTAVGILGSLVAGPFIGVLVYYFYAVARPQAMWDYVLPAMEFGWSYWVALGIMAATAIARLGLLQYPTYGPTQGAREPRWNLIHVCLMVFALWQTMSYVLSEDQRHAYTAYLEYVKIFVMFLLSSYSLGRSSQLWHLLGVIALANVYVAYEMNAQYFQGYNAIQRNGFGGLDNNGAALTISMSIPMCYFLWESSRGYLRWGLLLAIPVIAHAVQLSFSRGALLSVLMAAPLLFVLSRKKLFIGGVYVLGAAFVVFTSGPELRERFTSISKHEDDGSAQERFRTWATAVQLANNKPLFGYGVRCSTLHTKEVNGIEKQAIHNTYLQTAADSGWPGMLLYIGMTGGAMLAGWRVWWKLRNWPQVDAVVRARAVAAMVVSSLAIYSVGAFFLSLEIVEISYIVVLVGAQLWSVYTSGGIEAAARMELAANPATLRMRPAYRPYVAI